MFRQNADRHFALHRRLIVGRARHVPPEHVVAAWETPLSRRHRLHKDPPQIIAAGYDNDGILLEMTAQDADRYDDAQGNPLRVIFHAMPATKPFLRELGVNENMIEQ